MKCEKESVFILFLQDWGLVPAGLGPSHQKERDDGLLSADGAWDSGEYSVWRGLLHRPLVQMISFYITVTLARVPAGKLLMWSYSTRSCNDMFYPSFLRTDLSWVYLICVGELCRWFAAFSYWVHCFLSPPNRFTSCYDLLLSRFCAWDYKAHGITGIKINRIIRIHNRSLRLRFEDKLHTLLASEESTMFSQWVPMMRQLNLKMAPLSSTRSVPFLYDIHLSSSVLCLCLILHRNSWTFMFFDNRPHKLKYFDSIYICLTAVPSVQELQTLAGVPVLCVWSWKNQ